MQAKGSLRLIHTKSLGLAIIFATTWIMSGCGSTAKVDTPQNPQNPGTLAISNVNASAVSSTGATINWTTNINGTSQVDYGTTTNYGSTTTFDPTMTQTHSVTLTGLAQGTVYNVRVRSKDANAIETMGTNFQFTTNSPNAPNISGISSAPTLNSATITFTTDKPAKGQIDYGTTTSYGSSSTVEANLVTSHSITISNLASGTTYNFRVRATDANNIQGLSGNTTFKTNSGTPPAITAVAASAGTTVVTVTWTTDKAANQQVEYGTTPSYGQITSGGSTLQTTHSVILSGLNPSTTYNYRVRSTDASGNIGISGNFTFTTQADTTPPVLSLISALPSSTAATITWTTNKLSDTQVDYGATTAYGQSTTLNSQLVTAHSTVITGLSASTTYNFRVKSRDGSGNLATSGNFTFTTTAGGTTVPLGLGWTQLPNTLLQSVCPANDSSYSFNTNCYQVIQAWSGGMADAARNRLIVWGGGHNDYYGNEIYALNMSDQKLIRLNNPGPVADPAANQVALSNGTPNSRHTYGGLAYIAHADRMFVFGGDPAATFGFASNDTWTLDLNTLQWQRMDPVTGGSPAHAFGVVSDYDPNSRNVYLHDGQTFWQYTYETNTYKSLDSSSPSITIYNSAVIDPKRKLFFIIGSGMHVISIAPGSNYLQQDWTSQTTGCDTLQTTDYPGVAYDPVQDKIVGWTGGNSVYVFDPDTKTCTTVTNPNGPGASQQNGTHGRFRYLPGINAFVVVNGASQNAYALKLSNSGTATDFNGRCQSPGVIRCWSFDDATATDAHVFPPNGSTVKRAGVVTDVVADGTGSLRFTIPSQSGADSGGSFWLDFADDFSQQFDQGQEFYIQYRVRYNDVILNTTYNALGGTGISGGFKMSITGEGDRPGTTAFSCTTLELPLQNIDQTGLPRAYHSCGTFQQLQVQIPNTSEFLDQNAAGCPHYGDQGFAKTEPPCFKYKPFEWITIQQHVKIGHWGQPDSTVEYWAADQGQTSRLIISLANFTLLNDNPGVAKYGKVWLLPYQTNKDDTQVTGTGQVWYDDLIISTQRIPDADVSTPNAPDILQALPGSTTGTIQVSWRDNSAATEQGFKIERCTGSANTCMATPSQFAQITTVGPNITSYTDVGLVSGRTYSYRVKAYNASGDSAYTGGACFSGGTSCYSQAVAK